MTQKATDRESMVPPEVRERMKQVKHKIVVLSGKGGVGKSTVSANLAMAFAKMGASVGVLDVDIYGPTIPKVLGLEGQHPEVSDNSIQPVEGPLGSKIMSMGFLLRNADDAVAWRGPLVAKAITQFLSDVQWGALDVLVVDLPPGTGDEILSILQSIPAVDGTLIISTPQEVAVLGARRAIQLTQKMGVNVLGVVENMGEYVCPKCGERYRMMGEGAVIRAATDYGVMYLGSLPMDPAIVKFSDEGRPFVIAAPESESTKAFMALAKKISNLIGLGK
ncbi:MAG: Mrp/NBP35 family ATP-binding protein [Candidatus Thorarchaeota archaeon]|nr:Mrp/NBP35 family ATP-binding protein [Candidatus Thorarchaeota archaeon]